MSSEADIVSLRVTLRYKDLEEFALRYAENISTAGLFLRTKAPKPAGTKIRFELLLSDGTRALRGEGVVVTVRDGDKPGMAIRYNVLDAESNAVVERVVATYGQGALAPTPLSTRFGKNAPPASLQPAPRLRSAAAPWTARPAPVGWSAASTKSGSSPSALPRRSLRPFGDVTPVPGSTSGSSEAAKEPEVAPSDTTAPSPPPAEAAGAAPRKRSSVLRPWAKSGSGAPTTQDLMDQIRAKESREDGKTAPDRAETDRPNRVSRQRESSAIDVAKASERLEVRPLDRRDTQLDDNRGRVPPRRPDSFDIEPPVEAGWPGQEESDAGAPSRAETVLEPGGTTPADPDAFSVDESATLSGVVLQKAAPEIEHFEVSRSAPDRAPTELADPHRHALAERAPTVLEPMAEEPAGSAELVGEATLDTLARVPALSLPDDDGRPVDPEAELQAIEAELARRDEEDRLHREAAALREREAEPRRDTPRYSDAELEAAPPEAERAPRRETPRFTDEELDQGLDLGAESADSAESSDPRAEASSDLGAGVNPADPAPRRSATLRSSLAPWSEEAAGPPPEASRPHEAESTAPSGVETTPPDEGSNAIALFREAQARHEAALAREFEEERRREELLASAREAERLREDARQRDEAARRLEAEQFEREAAEAEAQREAAEAEVQREREAVEAEAQREREALATDVFARRPDVAPLLPSTTDAFGATPREPVAASNSGLFGATPKEGLQLEHAEFAVSASEGELRAREVSPLESPAEAERTPISHTEIDPWADEARAPEPSVSTHDTADLAQKPSPTPDAPLRDTGPLDAEATSPSRDLPEAGFTPAGHPGESGARSVAERHEAGSAGFTPAGHPGESGARSVAERHEAGSAGFTPAGHPGADTSAGSEAAPSSRPPPRRGPMRAAIERDLTGSLPPTDPAELGAASRAEIRATSDITVRPARDDTELTPPPVRTEGPATLIGIDFGGRWLRMCTAQDGTNEFIPIGPSPFIPALVGARSDGTLAVGAKARQIFVDDPWRTIAPRTVLRLMTHGTIDPVGRPQNVRLEGGRVLVDLGTRSVEFEEIVTALFAHLREGAMVHLRDTKLAAAVSIPNDLDPSAAALLSRACHTAGFEAVRLVKESDALLNAYKLEDPKLDTALLVDVGATHVGLTLAKREPGAPFAVIGSRWLDDMSATEIDNRIVDVALEELKVQKDDAPHQDPALRSKLLDAVERARVDIRRNATVELKVSLQSPGASNVAIERTIKLQRSRIYEVTEEPIRAICSRVQDLLRDTGLHPRQLGVTILAGSAGLYPPLLQALTVLTSKDPFASVPTAHVYAVGLAKAEAPEPVPATPVAPRAAPAARPAPPVASTQAASAEAAPTGRAPSAPPAPPAPSVDVPAEASGASSVLTMSVGIALPGGRFRPLIKKGETLPAQMKRTHTTTREDQTEVEIELYEGETDHLKDAIRLGTVALTDVPRKPRGAVQVEMTIDVDRDEAVTVTLFEPSANNKVEQVFATRATPDARRAAIAEKLAQQQAEPKAPSKKGGLLSRLLGRS